LRPRLPDPTRHRVLCVCGPPAAGKSIAAELIAARTSAVVIETGQVVARLLRRGNVHKLPRQEQARFRREAVALVTGPGTTPLVRALRRRLKAAGGPVILVGIRNASTIEGLLRARTVCIRLLFLRAPLRVRARRYKEREGDEALTYEQLLRARTEAEHSDLARMADQTIDNGGDMPTLRRAVGQSRRWLFAR
jgi:dephospho-CoA kinase